MHRDKSYVKASRLPCNMFTDASGGLRTQSLAHSQPLVYAAGLALLGEPSMFMDEACGRANILVHPAYRQPRLRRIGTASRGIENAPRVMILLRGQTLCNKTLRAAPWYCTKTTTSCTDCRRENDMRDWVVYSLAIKNYTFKRAVCCQQEQASTMLLATHQSRQP
jgi:hypothetical protein